MVDWRLAERVAEAVAGGDGAGAPLAGGADLDAMAARAVEHVTEYARIRPSTRWSFPSKAITSPAAASSSRAAPPTQASPPRGHTTSCSRPTRS